MKIVKYIILVVLTFGCFGAVAQNAKISTKLTADTVMIGDQVQLQVEIEKDVAAQVGLPEFKDNKIAEKLEIVGLPTIDTISKNGRSHKIQINYTITSFDAGSYALQGFPIVLQNANGTTDTLEAYTVNYLTVKTFDIDTTKQEIFDIKEPIHTPLVFAEIKDYVMWGAVAAVILAVILYFVIKWLKNRKQAIANRPKEPAHIVAIKALEALKHRKMWQSGNVKEYYSVLSDILRQYLEDRYQIGALEMTSDEILNAIKEINNAKQIDNIKEFAMLSDLAKFAKWTPMSDENEAAWETIFNYVEQTKIMVATENE